MAEKEETERLIRNARVRCRTIGEAYEKEEYDDIIGNAYSIMYMAAKATINHLGATASSHRQVASLFRKELIGRRIVDRKYQDHLRKIREYRDEYLAGDREQFDKEKMGAIVQGCNDFVEILNKVIKKYEEPIIDYDISDFA
jgi:uncharacterized protein (UPF0332 family)